MNINADKISKYDAWFLEIYRLWKKCRKLKSELMSANSRERYIILNFFRYLKKIILDDFKLVILYIIFVLFFSVFYITFEWSEGLRKIDKYLDMAVSTVPLLLEEDFHDRALGSESISFEEELKNRKKINSFVKTINLEWVYTLVNYRGKYYFSAPTVTDEEAEEIERWYFYPYDDVPRFFQRCIY